MEEKSNQQYIYLFRGAFEAARKDAALGNGFKASLEYFLVLGTIPAIPFELFGRGLIGLAKIINKSLQHKKS